jgi:predicted kinase
MSSIVVLIGVSGSGKSTLAKRSKERAESDPVKTIICSTDSFIDEEAEKLGKTYQEMMKQLQETKTFGTLTGRFYDEIEDGIKKDYNIIIDRTNLSRGGRMALLEKLKEMHKKHDKTMESMAVCLKLTREQLDRFLSKRIEEGGKTIPSEILENQMKNLEIPVKEEGFDRVEVYEPA